MQAKKYIAAFTAAAMLMGCGTDQDPSADSTDTEIIQTVESTLYGEAYTNAKSTLKAEYGVDVTYGDDSKAVITLTSADGSAIDDAKIDTSNASVTLEDGDAYNVDQFNFIGTELGNDIKDGAITYRLKEGDITPSNGGYMTDNGGREWSALGSDGKGLYYFNLKVSGICYDSQELDPLTFRACVQIYGYDYTADADEMYPPVQTVDASFQELSENVQADETPVFTWLGDGSKPILCDEMADRFYISWPDEQDASALTADDIAIKLYGQFGDEKTLTPDKDYFVSAAPQETQIVVSYQYWAYAPVYTDMSITVSSDAVKGIEEDIEQDYEIASVYVNLVQYGGGMDRDNTVVAIQLIGWEDLGTLESLGMPFFYNLSTDDGKFYAEKEDGTAYLTDNHEEAMQFDASGSDDMNPAFISDTIFFTEHFGRTMEKEVDEKTVTFNMNYGNGYPMLSPDMKLMAGYTPMKGMMDHHKWAWQSSLKEGWTAINVTPVEGRYTWDVEKGNSEDFDADSVNVTWNVVGAASADTSIDENGILTVSQDETASSFAIICQDAEGNYGGLTVNVK